METTPEEELLNDITFMAIDHGMESIKDDAAPLIPFAIYFENKGEKKIERFLTERLEDGPDKAKERIDSLCGSISRFAIAWDGYVTIEGKKWDAIIVESGSSDLDSGYLMCQRYERKGLFKKKNLPHGNPALMEKPKSRLR